MLLLLAIIIFGLVYLHKKSDHACPKNSEISFAEEIIKKRYINGEIDDETYIKMLKNVRS